MIYYIKECILIKAYQENTNWTYIFFYYRIKNNQHAKQTNLFLSVLNNIPEALKERTHP